MESITARVAITQSPLFFTWPDQIRARMIASADILRLAPGDYLQAAGEFATHIFIVASGSVRLVRMAANGREFTVWIYFPGDFHGLGPIMTGEAYASAAIAREPAVIVRVPSTVIREIVSQNGALVFSLFKALDGRHRRILGLYETAVTLPVRARLLDLLVSIVLRQRPAAKSAEILLSQGELAVMLGSRRQVVNRIMTRLEHESLLEAQYGRIVVPDVSRLRCVRDGEVGAPQATQHRPA